MNFTKSINVQGSLSVADLVVYLNFNYTDPMEPSILNFSFCFEGTSVSGSITKNGISCYNVSNGFIDRELMQAVVEQCLPVFETYRTI